MMLEFQRLAKNPIKILKIRLKSYVTGWPLFLVASSHLFSPSSLTDKTCKVY